MNNNISCKVCGKELKGKQKKFCCQKHKHLSSNNKYQNYLAQRARSKQRKTFLVKKMGGKCDRCGYNRNLAALCFHHRENKTMRLDYRSLANHSMEVILSEAEKCILLCHNCHMETHYPDEALE